MANNTFLKLGTRMLSNKLVADYREVKRIVPESEFEHFAQNWLGVWVEGDDLAEAVFADAMLLMSRR